MVAAHDKQNRIIEPRFLMTACQLGTIGSGSATGNHIAGNFLPYKNCDWNNVQIALSSLQKIIHWNNGINTSKQYSILYMMVINFKILQSKYF